MHRERQRPAGKHDAACAPRDRLEPTQNSLFLEEMPLSGLNKIQLLSLICSKKKKKKGLSKLPQQACPGAAPVLESCLLIVV